MLCDEEHVDNAQAGVWGINLFRLASRFLVNPPLMSRTRRRFQGNELQEGCAVQGRGALRMVSPGRMRHAVQVCYLLRSSWGGGGSEQGEATAAKRQASSRIDSWCSTPRVRREYQAQERVSTGSGSGQPLRVSSRPVCSDMTLVSPEKAFFVVREVEGGL